MENVSKTYLPAPGRDWALEFYDPLMKLMGGETAHRKLLTQAAIEPRHRILDIGCGTGTLAVLAQRLYPDAAVAGLDPDPRALARACRKAQEASVPVRFDQGFGQKLPYPDESFDRVLSSFMLHHLQPEQKAATLLETRRILAPGGSLHLMDFSSRRTADNPEPRILEWMEHAGFASFGRVGSGGLLFGLLGIAYYSASVGTTARMAP